MSEELHWLPGWKLARRIAAKELSPVELVEHLLARLDVLEPTLNSMITVAADHALAAARDAETAVVRGDSLGPLHGVPFSVKDLLRTKGVRSTMGSRLYEDFVPDEDAASVARARAAGAIMIGKTNTPEFGLYGRGLNLVSNEAVNPWDTTRVAGGSSSGSGVAIAAGLAPLSIGTDGGGSIRLPSAFNGVFGLHPSRGLVPHHPEFFWNPLQGIGPMTRDVRDAALLLGAIAGPHPRDPLTRGVEVADYLATLDDGVAGIRFAWSADFGYIEPVDARVVDAVADAVTVFETAGGHVDEPGLRVEDLFDMLRRVRVIDYEQVQAELAALRPPDVPTSEEFWAGIFADPAKRRLVTLYVLDRNEHPTQLEYTMSIPSGVRNMAVDHLDDVFRRYDVLLSPVISRVAPATGELWHSPWTYIPYTFIVNVAGYCAASVPCGFVDGLPVGMQLMAPPGEEALVLRAARAFELHRPWAQARPPFAP